MGNNLAIFRQILLRRATQPPAPQSIDPEVIAEAVAAGMKKVFSPLISDDGTALRFKDKDGYRPYGGG